MRLPVLLTCLVAALAPGAPAEADPPHHEESRSVMGTLAVVAAWADDPGTAARAVEAAYGVFARVDSLMSTWRDDSAVATLNRAPAGEWVVVGEEVAAVLAAALRAADASDGAYDPTVLPLVRLWGFRGGEPAAPTEDRLAAELSCIGYRRLEVDEAAGCARLLGEGMAVDLGGIAKGHALDAAAEAMRSAGASAGALDLGGGVLVFGAEAATEVEVRALRGPGSLAVLPLDSGAAATSGQYERFLIIDGRRHGHILDPRTGRPVSGGLSVTVLADRAILADALATAAVVLGPAEGLALLESFSGVEGLLAVDTGEAEPCLIPTSGLEETP